MVFSFRAVFLDCMIELSPYIAHGGVRMLRGFLNESHLPALAFGCV